MSERQDTYFRELASKAHTTSEVAMNKIVDHEKLCSERYKANMSWLKATFFTLLSSCGFLIFYIITHH